jgi:hypothetical protein
MAAHPLPAATTATRERGGGYREAGEPTLIVRKAWTRPRGIGGIVLGAIAAAFLAVVVRRPVGIGIGLGLAAAWVALALARQRRSMRPYELRSTPRATTLDGATFGALRGVRSIHDPRGPGSVELDVGDGRRRALGHGLAAHEARALALTIAQHLGMEIEETGDGVVARAVGAAAEKRVTEVLPGGIRVTREPIAGEAPALHVEVPPPSIWGSLGWLLFFVAFGAPWIAALVWTPLWIGKLAVLGPALMFAIGIFVLVRKIVLRPRLELDAWIVRGELCVSRNGGAEEHVGVVASVVARSGGSQYCSLVCEAGTRSGVVLVDWMRAAEGEGLVERFAQQLGFVTERTAGRDLVARRKGAG